MIYKISKHYYYTDEGESVDRGITRSWDKWYTYSYKLVKVILVNEDRPSDRKNIIIKQDYFNPEDYPIGARYEVTPKSLFRKAKWRRVSDGEWK